MAESTQDDEAYEPTTEFHNFLKLPVELQYAIWHLNWPPTRHYFSLNNAPRREYAAVDVERKSYVDRVVLKDRDHLSNFMPFLSKIQLIGAINVRYGGPMTQDTSFYKYDYHLECMDKPVICVDFSRDTFYFDYCSYPYHRTYTREDEWFRFLRNPISQYRPPLLCEDHWIFKVRNLALFLRRKGLKGSSWDHSILKNMKSLKSVLLVTPQYFSMGDSLLDPYCNVLDPFFMADEVSHRRLDQMRLDARLSKKYLGGKMKEYGLDTRLVVAGCGKEDHKVGMKPNLLRNI
ncbi:uncharacterized protein F4807DRAFT_459962 [Annulohypoxylon truncatum]|uniref:uncharacterized protein n=1 Tax=Annulohypoxylon truncatum TaxID=327061 RepID=UPI0020087E9E|nr:uncharacterized protein F4807DRAFT_459962 [Annulohypoxylon truncatum]KAI1210130.1 hypothetical protein F4807DRAFT_459962 [Annulohypoxylon truncatum]